MKHFYVTTFLLLLSLSTFAQMEKDLLLDLSALVKKTPIATRSNFADTIPFSVEQGRIIIPVESGGKARRFIFDTGSPSVLYEKVQSEIKYEHIREGRLPNLMNANNILSMIEVDEMYIGKTLYMNIPMLTYDEYTPENRKQIFNCLNVDGVLGSNLLNHFAIKIDINNKQLIITDKKNFFKSESKSGMPLTITSGGIPMIELHPFGDNGPDKAVFDTGNDCFYQPYEVKLQEYLSNNSKLNQQVVDISRSLDADIRAQAGHRLLSLKELKLNKNTFTGVVTRSGYTHDSRVGARLLNHGTVILDYLNQRFTFTPYGKGSTIKAQNKLKELEMTPVKGRMVVDMIWKNSVAYKAGIRKGDIIKSVNGITLTTSNCPMAFWDTPSLDTNRFTVIVIDSKTNKEKTCRLNY